MIRPLQSFKIEHGLFCRLVIAPYPAICEDRELLHEKRMDAAARALRALARKAELDEVIEVARRMARLQRMTRGLPNPPPSFVFGEADAVRMAHEAFALRATDTHA